VTCTHIHTRTHTQTQTHTRTHTHTHTHTHTFKHSHTHTHTHTANRVLKVLAEAVDTDPEILEKSSVLQAVRQRYVADHSALVRAAAVDILAAYSAHTRRIEPQDLSALCTRSYDVSAHVRLSASNALSAIVSLGRQYLAKEETGALVGVTQEQKTNALMRLCRLAVDQEPAVRKRSLRQVVELWFLSASSCSSSSSGRSASSCSSSSSACSSAAQSSAARGSEAAPNTEEEGRRAAHTSVENDNTSTCRRARVRDPAAIADEGAHVCPKVSKGVLDEMVTVSMYTIMEQARKGPGGSNSTSEMCLLRRVLLRALETGSNVADVPAASPATKGQSTAKTAAAAGSATAVAPVVVVGAEDETMDAGGAASVVVLSDGERRLVEQRCRAVCAQLVMRVVRLRPKRASSDSDEADDRPTDGKVLTERLEQLLGATAALLSFVESLPHMTWTVPMISKLIEPASLDEKALEELVGGGSGSSHFYGLRMRIVAQSALLADAVITTAPSEALEREVLPIANELQKHLAAAANRLRSSVAVHAVIKCLCTLSTKVLPAEGVPHIAFMSFCKYVEFVAKFAKQRSQRHLPFVSNALLGTGALCRYMDWKTTLGAFKDSQAAARMRMFDKYHGQMVEMCVGVLAHDEQEGVRRCALQCLGGMLVHSPTLLLQEATSKLVKSALKGETDATAQQAGRI